MAGIRVTLLGTGNPRPLPDRGGPATLVEGGGERFLFDCGRGVTERLFARSLLPAVDDVLLTHLHSDHVVGLPDLWLTGWIFGRAAPLRVRGPPGTKSLVAHLEEAFAFDVGVRRDRDEALPPGGARLEAEELAPGAAVERGATRITAIPVDHGPVQPAFGYRIEHGGRTVVLSGDTRPCEALAEAAAGADLLVHEVADATEAQQQASELTRRVLAHHSRPAEAAGIFSRARPRLAVYSHIVLLGGLTREDLEARTRAGYDGPFLLGEDGMVFDVDDAIGVRRT
jgi:ribonuclease Z